MPQMLMSPRASDYSGLRRFNRARFQYAGALLLGALLPTAIVALLNENLIPSSSGPMTAGGVAAAAIISVYLLRNISLYPGISGAFFALPSVMISFGSVFFLFLMLRIDYSRSLLLAASAGTLLWLYLFHLLIAGRSSLRVAAVPIGDIQPLFATRLTTVRVLERAEMPAGGWRDDVLVADFRSDLSHWETFLADCALGGIPVLHVKQLIESLTGQVDIEHLSENSFGSLVPFLGYLKLRRIIDFLTALVVGACLLPLFVVVAVLIKLDSPGPVLFRQVRIGFRGEPFRVAKFRTMVTGQSAEGARERAMTQDNDARITRIGRFLRRSRIDELPQILNILKGEMSWIGPRPEAEALSVWYESELPFYRYRHIVPPGITGWAQVNQGHVVDLQQVTSKLHYDFYYIKYFSPWLDALIVAKTIQTMLSGFGAR